MSSCNYQPASQQCIDWPILIQYVDDLKTRIYKAFLKQARLKICYLQLCCITSPLVTLVAAKCYAQPAGLHVNCFELAYLVFSVSCSLHVDTSFYCYYREKSIIKIAPLLDFWIEKVKLTVLVWCIKHYDLSILPQRGLLLCRPKTALALRSVISRSMPDFQHILLLDLNPCFNYFYLSGLIQRLSLARDVELYLLNWLGSGLFSYLALHSTVFLGSIMFVENSQGLFRGLVNILVSLVCTELSIAFYGLNAVDGPSKNLVFVCYESTVLILCQESLKSLSMLSRQLKDFGLFNGVGLMHVQSVSSIYSFSGTISRMLSVNYQDFFNASTVSFKPSLCAQFALMRRISLVLSPSAPHSLHLLVIRLNKLLHIWSSIYLDSCSAGKVFYLIDYLVGVRVKLFLKKQKVNCRQLDYALPVSLKRANSSVSVCSKLSSSILAFISTNDFYAQYVSIKIFWIYRLLCLSN